MEYPELKKFSLLKETETTTSDSTSPLSPSEDKTVQGILNEIRLAHQGAESIEWLKRHHDVAIISPDECYRAMTEYGNVRWNKAIEEVIERLNLKCTKLVRVEDLISELNKMKV